MSQSIGSSGTLVAAALESLGYYYQSYVLETLGSVIAGPAAVLIFVILALSAIGRFILTGRVPQMLGWALVGPSLMFSIVTQRTETRGAEWRFGSRVKEQGQVEYRIREFLTGDALATELPPAQVSSLFAHYTRLVSRVSNSLVDVLTKTREGLDSRFLIRTEMAAIMRSSSVSDQELRELIHGPFIRDCARLLAAANDVVATPGSSMVQQFDLTAGEKEVLLNAPAKLRGSWSHATRYVASLKIQFPTLYSAAFTLPPEEFGKLIADSPELHVSSSQQEFDAEELSRTIPLVPASVRCADVWNLIYLGLFRYSAIHNDWYQELSDDQPGDKEALLKQLLKIKRTEDASGVQLADSRARLLYHFNRLLASYLLRNELQRPSSAAFIQNYASKGFEFTALAAPGEKDMSFAERTRAAGMEWQERSNLVATAAGLPYYQGLTLYLLALLFPFFSLLLLIPSQMKNFALWFFLWLWVKSWDVGIAIVMILDDILYNLFQEGQTTSEELAKQGLGSEVFNAIWAIKELDPTFQLSTYYAIVGAALGAVPIISSYLVLGSLKGGAGLIVGGAQQLSRSIAAAGFIGSRQTMADAARRAASEGEQQRTAAEFNRDFKGPGSGSPDTSDYSPGSPRYNNAYQQGPYAGLSGEDKQSNLQASSESMGAAGAVLRGDGLTSSMSGRIPTAAPETMQGYRQATSVLLAGSEAIEAQRRAALSRELELTQTALQTDFAKRLAGATYEAYITPALQRATAIGRMNGMIDVPIMDKDGDEQKMLDAQVALYGANKMLELSDREGVAALIAVGDITTVEGMLKYQMYLSGRGVTRPVTSVTQTWPGSQDSPQSPVGDNATVSSEFGVLRQNPDGTTRTHAGVDLAVELGTPVRPMNNGWIVDRGYDSENGHYVIIQESPTRRYRFSHLSPPTDTSPLTTPQRVTSDTVVGHVGLSGRTTGAHLHFEIIQGHYNYFYLDPKAFLDGNTEGAKKLPVSERKTEYFRELDKRFNEGVVHTVAAPFELPPSSLFPE